MIPISSRDFVYSVILHAGLILMITMLNPFVVRSRHDLESIAVNIITLPPLGDPTLAKGGVKAVVPQKTVADEAAVPITTPKPKEDVKKTDKKPATDKPKQTPKKDTGYKGSAQKGDTSRAGGTEASDLVGPGSKFGTVAIDNAGFDYPYYFVQAFGKIQQNWSNPVAANQLMSCVIYFKIIRSGTVIDPQIEKSSGVAAYDRAALRAVVSSSPLPPLPADFRDDIIGIHLEFPYLP